MRAHIRPGAVRIGGSSVRGARAQRRGCFATCAEQRVRRELRFFADVRDGGGGAMRWGAGQITRQGSRGNDPWDCGGLCGRGMADRRPAA